MASDSPVAVITGGASGMGLALAEDLAQKNWNVAVLDINDKGGKALEGKFTGKVSYFRANVVDYEAQAAAFESVWNSWGRLDFVWANAGIGDRIPYLDPPAKLDGNSPPKPDVLVIDVDLYGAVYSSYLALFYFRKNKTGAGKLVMTSSTAGLYPNIALPLYGAAKHGVVGLARNMALILEARKEPIEINCICPGLVKTGIPAKEMFDIFPAEHVTPMDTILHCMNQFIEEDLNGRVMECSGPNINRVDAPDYSDEHSRFLNHTFPINMTFLAANAMDEHT
ncbi:Bacilysin biosynthesis oxidoreductase BacC [Cercospora beticola]|uniref:Bacilysin biosynthesis oxidoreductase BacC n=1 Tax=Cercospora beticola TaxID=122368 RepID=A0A2G5HZC5_CERBT|nr:Bacilysin biosynthesis oxidoreductase BacC [Cercospora beticola]PIA97886.1 Bacilysin biosynthesis oxidoreductase BacC [Cercospora beticola]WPA98528.1 hypothetical protein RHO25_003140 [Cercospora beticola]